MKRTVGFVLAMLMAGMTLSSASAQDQNKADEKGSASVSSTPVKVQIVFSEFDGDKKVKSLPYIISVNAPDMQDWKSGFVNWTKLRIGSRVPVYTGGNSGNMQYIDVGTNIDARAIHPAEGRLHLAVNLERSWVEGGVSVPVSKSSGSPLETTEGQFTQPVIRQFKSELDLKLREGQVTESTMATDPQSGKVLKVEVSFTTVK